tara:strand:- start:3156 stop:4718 length:1563 start_codon:yes stop_codon:yes gene_type:complete
MKDMMYKYVLHFAVIILLAMLSVKALASDIEEVIVIGANISNGYSNPETDSSLIEALDPTRIYQPGGLGGFVGATPNGTDVKHTTVYRNGIPVNDPGSGWYDFGTETPTFQTLKMISGPNSALYGSSSMAGTILMEDNFDGNNFFTKAGDGLFYVQGGTESWHLSRYKGSNGSVKTDNNEEDWFENVTLKTKTEIGNWKVINVLQDYSYDYDSCYDSSFAKVNTCTQEGVKSDLSIRNDWFTAGYSLNDVKHNTGWSAKSERYFVDANKEVYKDLILGIQNQREYYDDKSDYHTSFYANYNTELFGFGYRYEEDQHIYRVGHSHNGWNISLANSFRKPNLYERYGDDWVRSNPYLQPEKGKGVEASYVGITAWYYKFQEGIDYNFATSSYYNIGKYETKGIKYNKSILLDQGNLNVFVQYTDSDRIRVPEYKTRISWAGESQDGRFDYMVTYIGQFEKGLEFDGRPIDDVTTISLYTGYDLTPRHRLGFQISDIFDREFEILPDYSAGGRTFTLSLDLSL